MGGSESGDIFENVHADTIPFARPEAIAEPAQPEVSAGLAGTWSFYDEFRRAHGLTHLLHPEPPEIALQEGTTLVIPLWIRNRTAKTQEITLSAALPSGWTAESGTGKFAGISGEGTWSCTHPRSADGRQLSICHQKSSWKLP